MIISDDGEMVEFRTRSPFFEREKDGRKANTVRCFKNSDEEDKFISALFSLNKIRIKNIDNNDTFERVITDVTICPTPEIHMPKVFVISWQHLE